MVKLAEYSRTATFAWSHERIPSLVTGTASGTVDANFSSESALELWSLLASDPSKPKASLAVDAKFNDLDWSNDDKIIAGALDSGVVELFSSTGDSLKSEARFQQHQGAAKTVKFNSKQNNVLASGGSKGEIYIWDLNTCLKKSEGYTPLTPGVASTPIEEVTSLAWNQSLAHVFASAGSTSYASIWDLKAKKEVIHLSYASPSTGLKSQLSVVEWHPKNSTRVATATGSDTEPLILVWDLRNANTPLQVLSKGHSKGILSLDWCSQDEELLLSSGRDNTIVLWNPESGQELTQFPTRGNWCFKTKFAPEAPDLFASASFDNKIQVQTLQNLVNTLDQEQTESKQKESETDFWNNVTQEDSNEKPNMIHLQAPSWYGNKSPAAQWAFGGKLVHISADGRSVSITKPSLPGLEENTMLDQALKSSDFKPLINRRLAKTIDDTNDEDWNLLEKLSMDGKDEILKEAFTFDDEEERKEKNKIDEGEDFFANIEEAFQPEGEFSLSRDVEKQISQDVVGGNLKSAVSASLDDDLLLEAMIIALDSGDKTLKDSVKRYYFTKYGNKSPLSRFLFSISNGNADDLVKNLEISQWKYAAKAIDRFYANDLQSKNEQLEKLAYRLLESGNRQDAILLYLSANSLDKVAEVWLKEAQGLEEKVQKNKGSLYEAHSESLTEFIERFTVLAKLVGEKTKITNEDLISKFMEYVNLASSSGTFDLAYSILETLPAENREVQLEKERVLLASGKSVKNVKSAQKASFAQPSMKPAAGALPYGAVTPGYVPPGGVLPNARVGPQIAQPLAGSVGGSNTNPYAPPAGSPALGTRYAPTTASPNTYPMSMPAATQSSFTPPANPYAASAVNTAGVPIAGQSSYTPLNPKPVPNFISSPPAYGAAEPPTGPPPPTVASGQTPSLNRKANDGWNDLPLPVKEKPSRAKAGSVAPVKIAAAQTAAPANGISRPPLVGKVSSMTPSLSSPLPPPPVKSSRMASVSSNGSMMSNSPMTGSTNPYAPPVVSNISTPRVNATDYSAPQAPAIANPYAPPAVSSPKLNQPNPYAPPAQTAPMAGLPSNPYANPVGPSQPPAAQKPPIGPPPVGPPPMSLKKKNHSSTTVENASHLLESVQKKPESPYSRPQVAAPPSADTAPVLSAAVVGATATSAAAPEGIPEDQQPIMDFLKEELARVTPLIPKEYTKQLKDCDKRLNILYGHLEKQDLLTQPTIDKLRSLTQFLKEKNYSEAMQVHVDIATNHAQEGGNWLTGVKRLIGIAEATSS